MKTYRMIRCALFGHPRRKLDVVGTKHLVLGGEILICSVCPRCDHFEHHHIDVSRFFSPTTETQEPQL